MYDFDVIVVGASYAGSFLAGSLAKKGYRILLIDKQEKQEIGKHISNQMIEIDTFSKTGIPRSNGEEFLAHIDTYYMYSPSGKVKKAVDFSSLLINGGLLIQRLLADAEAVGVHFLTADVQGVGIEDNAVRGISTREGQSYYAKGVVDASGIAGIVRCQLPEEWGLMREMLPSECGIACRQVRDSDIPPSELHLYLCMEKGYIWRSAHDIGLGTIDHSLDVEAVLASFIREQEWEPGEIKAQAKGLMPIKPPLPNLVANGCAIVGDAACMINTLRGSGISPALRGTRLLSDVLHDALQADDLSLERLWPYNVQYHHQIGEQLAYQDALRVGTLEMALESLEYAFAQDLITNEDLRLSLNGQTIQLQPWEKVQRGFRGIGNPTLLLHLDASLDWAKQLRRHFNRYPSTPDEFERWNKELTFLERKIHRE